MRERRGKSALLAFAVLVVSALAVSSQTPGDWLVSPEEAKQPEALIPRGGEELPSTGPIIQIHSPDLNKANSSPMSLEIRFVPREAPVLVSSLKVTLMKLVNIDITDRLKQYMTDSGIKISDAKLPKGKHRIRVHIADTKGGITEQDLLIRVE